MRKLMIFVLVLSLLFVAGCSGGDMIKDIKDNPDSYLGKDVSVTGNVSNTIKLGSLSGFTLSQGDSKISVASKTLPEEGSTVTVKGVVMKELLIGTYINADKIS